MNENQMIRGLDFTWKEILSAREEGRLLSFDLELSRACNLRCIYCYAESGLKRPNEMTLSEVFGVIEQAVALGAERAVVIGGGEPLMYPHYWEVIQYIRSLGLKSVTFTNGTHVDRVVAQRLFDLGEDVALKCNSFDSKTQDMLAGGFVGTGRAIQQALQALLDVGYSKRKDGPQLALETIVCRANISEIEQIYRFCRENRLIPYIEILTIQGNAKRNSSELSVGTHEAFGLFQRLLQYDREHWLIDWPLVPPIAGQNCKRMYYSAYVTCTGEVQPCPGITITGGNIRNLSLADILTNKDGVFGLARNIDTRIAEPCASCHFSKSIRCYGCRGTALHHTGSILNSDPTCWWLPSVSKSLGFHKPIDDEVILPRKSGHKVKPQGGNPHILAGLRNQSMSGVFFGCRRPLCNKTGFGSLPTGCGTVRG